MKPLNPFLKKNINTASQHTQFKHAMRGEEGIVKCTQRPPKSPVLQIKNPYLEDKQRLWCG